MSNESGGSGSQSIDVSSTTKSNAVQVTEHDIATSQLAVSQSAESLFPALYHSLSPQSASLMSSKLPATFSVSSVHARYDEREHQNLDATQYSRQSSEGSSQDTLEDQDARGTTPQPQPPSSEESELSMPHQTEKTDSMTSKMVITDYYSESLSSLYFLIQRRTEAVIDSRGASNDLANPGDNTSESVEATPLFAMDDEEPTQGVNKVESDDSPSAFTSRLSLNFANEKSAIPTQSLAAGNAASSLNDQSMLKNELYTPVINDVPDPDSSRYIDRADQHRDPHVQKNARNIEDDDVRPVSVPAVHNVNSNKQSGLEKNDHTVSDTPPPPQRSPATSNASETSTMSSSHSSVPAHKNHTEDQDVFETRQIECSFKRATLCCSIAHLSSQIVFDIKQKLKICGIQGELQFHSHGLDQDYNNYKGTVTAVFKFPKKPQRINIMNYEHCEFKLSVKVYEGPIRNNRIIGQSTSTRELDDDDRKRGILHMTVHKVVSLENIIFTDIDPPVDKLFMQTILELKAKGQNMHCKQEE